MPNLFWLLLAAARGGARYLRAILTLCMELRAEAEMAPGTDMSAEMASEMELTAAPVVRTAHDMALMGLAGEIRLTANMVCWIVNDIVFRWTADMEFVAAPIMAPGIPVAAVLPQEIPLTAVAETAPPKPMAFRWVADMGLDAAADTARPIPTSGAFLLPMEMDAMADTAPADPAAAGLTAALPELIARTVSGIPTPIVAHGAPELLLTARAMCWAGPEWVDENTLYIRFVYSTERDGDTLILH